jgi:hypothetical protein
MNFRIASTIGLSVGFVALILTGLLMYFTQYDYLTAALHVWSSIVVLGFVGGHFYNNWTPYKHHLKRKAGRRTFVIVTLGVIPISLGLLAEQAPFVTIIELGEKFRSASSVRDGKYETINLANSGIDNPIVELFIKAGKEYESDPQPLFWGMTYTATPQLAVWLEDEQGHFIKTLYVTGKTATSNFYSVKSDEERIRRPETLPYWSHKRGIQAQDGLYVPSVDSTEFDGMTSATPKGDHLLNMPIPKGDNYRLMVEVNRSYDFNDYYSRDRFSDDEIYSGSGSSGQPSLIYQAVFNLNDPAKKLLMLIGHGHHSGQNGILYDDLSKITSAKQILGFMVANFKKV